MVALLTLLATLAATTSYVVATPSEEITQLLTRQAAGFDPSMIPEQCRSECTSLASSISSGNCVDLTCLCGSGTTTAMSSCLRCSVTVIGASTAQTYYDNYANACKAAGKTVPTFSAASSGSGGSGSSGTSGSGTSGSGTSGTGSSGTGSSGTGSSGASRVQAASAGLLGAAAVGFLLAV